MLLFRSEEHLEDWLRMKEIERGAMMSLAQQLDLAQRWYSDRLHHDWAPRPVERSQAILESAGLSDPFWKLA